MSVDRAAQSRNHKYRRSSYRQSGFSEVAYLMLTRCGGALRTAATAAAGWLADLWEERQVDLNSQVFSPSKSPALFTTLVPASRVCGNGWGFPETPWCTPVECTALEPNPPLPAPLTHTLSSFQAVLSKVPWIWWDVWQWRGSIPTGVCGGQPGHLCLCAHWKESEVGWNGTESSALSDGSRHAGTCCSSQFHLQSLQESWGELS